MAGAIRISRQSLSAAVVCDAQEQAGHGTSAPEGRREGPSTWSRGPGAVSEAGRIYLGINLLAQEILDSSGVGALPLSLASGTDFQALEKPLGGWARSQK